MNLIEELQGASASGDAEGGVVPIGTAPLWEALDSLVSEQPVPPDDGVNHIWFRGLDIRAKSQAAGTLLAWTTLLTEQTKERRRPSDIEVLARHWQYTLLNLALATLQRKWLLISLKKNDYNEDFWLKHYDLRYTATKTIVEFMSLHGLAEVKKGAKYKNGPKRTRVFPTPELQSLLLNLALEAEEPIVPPYVHINSPSEGYEGVIESLPPDHPDPLRMEQINEFLKGHRWACKGPVRLVYKHDFLTSGRLITPFQSLPDRRARVRINTLIDGDPICEVDFSANHLRLNLAVLAGEDAGDSPYEDICEIAGFDRSTVKSFITIAMGADSESKAFSACKRERISRDQFNSLRDATLKRFPKIALFKGFGVTGQNFEGQILMDVLVRGVRDGVVALPVHDAVAVKQTDSAWAIEAMLEEWSKRVGSGDSRVRARVSIDRPKP